MAKKGRAILIAMIIAFIMAAPVYGSDAIATASGASPATGTDAIDLDLQVESIYRPDMFGQIRLGEYTVRAYRPDVNGWNTVIDSYDSAVYWTATATIYDHEKDGAGAVLLAEAGDKMVISNGWTTRSFVCVDEKPEGSSITFVVIGDDGVTGRKFFKEEIPVDH